MKLWLLVPLLVVAANSPGVTSWKDCPGLIGPGEAPPGLAECVAASGPIASESLDFALGESASTLQNASSLPLDFASTSVFVSDHPTNLRWRANGETFQFENVGGTGESALILDMGLEQRLTSIQFDWQNRPLNLSEAIDRARLLRARLDTAGFTPRGGSIPFTIFADMRSTDRHAADWDAAAQMLADDSQNVEEMLLYSLASSREDIFVSLKNMRRATWNFQEQGHVAPLPGWRRSIFDGDGGYEWLLSVSISQRHE